MANVTINQLPAADPLSGSEAAPLWQADQTVQASIADIVEAGLSDTGVTAGTYGASGASVPNVTVDAQGRLTAASNRTLTTSDLSAVPTSREISAGTGLSGGGDLSANRTFSIADTGVSAATYGSSSTVPVVAVNAQGQVTSATNTAIDVAAIGAVPTSRTITAGTGLTGGGDLTTNRTIALANTAVAAGTYGTNAATPRFTVDAQGRITLASTVPVVSLNITRAQIATTTISVPCFSVAGYSTAGDSGAGAIYVSGTSGGPKAIQDAAGTWFNLVTFRDTRIEDWNTTANSATVSAAITYLEGQGGGVLRWGPGSDTDQSNALTGTWPQYPNSLLYYNAPSIIVYPFSDAPGVGGTDSAKEVTRSQDAGSHSGSKHFARYLESRPAGSGVNGPNSADYGQAVSLIKHNWGTTTTPGEIDGMSIVIRQGGPDVTAASTSKSDCAAWLADVQNIGNSGYAAAFEAATSNIDRAFAYTRSIQIQGGVVHSSTDVTESYGFVATANNGTNTCGYFVQGGASGSWTSYIKAQAYGGTARFSISDSTAILNPTGWITNSSVNIAKVSNGYLQFYRKPRTVAGTFGADSTGDLGRTLLAAGGSPVTQTLQKGYPVGWWCDVVLYASGANPVTFSPESGATLVSKSGHTKCATLYGRVRLEIVENSDGNSAVWVLSGDTSA